MAPGADPNALPAASTAGRTRTLRIEEIPLDQIDELEGNLRLLAQPDSDLRETFATLTRRSLVRHQRDSIATATVTVSTSIPEDELCSRLQQVSRPYPYRFSSRFLGITPLYENEAGASIDVVAVPGLGSHALGSWKSPNSDDVWLLDYLPKDLPDVRVLLYGYDSMLQNNTSKQSIEDMGIDLLERIAAFRAHDGTGCRPILFIGHSLGGLLIKEALVHAARSDRDPEKLDLSRSCYGMLFFGVPNQGLRNEQLITIVRGQPNEALIRDLIVKDSEPSAFLRRISSDFARTCEGRHRVVSFFERRFSHTLKVHHGTLQKTGRQDLLVTKESATSTGLVAASAEDNIPLNTDHSGLIKYDSRYQDYYPIVRGRLEKLVIEAKSEIPRRFTGSCNTTPDLHTSSTSTKRLRSGSDTIPIMSGRDPKKPHNDLGCTENRICEDRCRSNQVTASNGANRVEAHGSSTVHVQNNYFSNPTPGDRQPRVGEAAPLDQKQKQKLLKSLRFEQDDARRTTVKLNCPGTCKWLLDEKAYRDWLDPAKLTEHHGFLWIKGKPGAGKSTLMKFAILETNKRHKDSTTISFFFYAQGSDLEKSTVGMYRWLLWELLTRIPTLQQVLDPSKRRLWDVDENYTWSIELLKELFMDSILRLESIPVLCFIDALDECDDTEIEDMLSFLEDVCDKAIEEGIQFRVYFSSRLYPFLSVKHHIPLILEDQEGHDKDITLYIQKKLDIGESSTAIKIKEELQKKASRVFLWVFLVVRILNKEYRKGNPQALRQRLDEIPAGLHSLFRRILLRDDEDRDGLVLCVQWLLFARQPLTPEQLYFAIQSGLEPDQLSSWDPNGILTDDIKRSLLNSSKGLAEITRSKLPTVQFIHESIRDYLLKENGLREIWPEIQDNYQAQSHDRLKRCCATYMSLDTSAILDLSKPLPQASSNEAADIRKLANKKFPFMKYAVRNILYHADLAEGGSIPQEALICDFPLVRWIELNNLFERYDVRRYTPRANLLYILAENNLPHLIAAHPSVLSYLDVGDERYGPPLFAAFATGSDRAVDAFLRAEMSQQAANEAFQRICTLYLQSRRGQSTFGRTFKFSKKTDISSYMEEHSVELLCALSYIGKAEVNVQDSYGRTPLAWAAKGGHEAVVRLLLETGQVEVDRPDSTNGRTPLVWAAKGGHEAIVRLLLETGQVEVDRPDSSYGRTPLVWAAKGGHKAIVRLLLEMGQVKVDQPDSIYGQTPLSWAAEGGHKAIVRLLLETGQVEVDQPDSTFSQTPLSWAAKGGHEAIVRLLLETGQVEVNQPDKYGQTPLSWAAKGGHEAVVRLLIETGQVEVDRPDDYGWIPLWRAAAGGHEVIVRLLLQGNSSIPGYKMIAELFLEMGQVEVDQPDSTYGQTPLSWAAKGGHEAIVRLLLEMGQVEVDQPDSTYGQTPLSWAAKGGHEAIVRLLLEMGQVEVDRPDSTFSQTPLSWAAKGGHEAIVRLLLETGQVEVNQPDKYGQTPLSWAAKGGHEAVVRLLRAR